MWLHTTAHNHSRIFSLKLLSLLIAQKSKWKGHQLLMHNLPAIHPTRAAQLWSPFYELPLVVPLLLPLPLSELFPGSSSDKEITLMNGHLERLQPGDEVMADKGFNLQDELAAVGVTLVTPAFLKGKTQFSPEESNKNKPLASLHVHVEHLMERIKNWHILDQKIPVSMAPCASDILIVIGVLSNFLPPLISPL